MQHEQTDQRTETRIQDVPTRECFYFPEDTDDSCELFMQVQGSEKNGKVLCLGLYGGEGKW